MNRDENADNQPHELAPFGVKGQVPVCKTLMRHQREGLMRISGGCHTS